MTAEPDRSRDKPKDPNRGAAGRFAQGNRANPGGRPRSGLAFADAVRRRVDPDKILDLLDRYLADEEVPLEKRLSIVLPFVHSGFLRPPTATQVNVTGSLTTSERPYAELPLDELRARIASAKAAVALALPSPTTDEDASP